MQVGQCGAAVACLECDSQGAVRALVRYGGSIATAETLLYGLPSLPIEIVDQTR